MSVKEIADAYPTLSEDGVQEVLRELAYEKEATALGVEMSFLDAK
jgi:hypothetical protein